MSTGNPIRLDPADWVFTGLGPFSGRADRRALYRIRHEWVESESGNFGMAEAAITVAGDWQPPFILSFYVSDDYAADLLTPPYDWWGVESYIGHRFKQVLIDGTVIWEADVADEGPRNCEIDVTPFVEPARTCKIAFRVIDKIGTGQVLPDDRLRLGTVEGSKTLGDPRKFYTNVWWGDVTLRDRNTAAPGPFSWRDRVVPAGGGFPLPPLDRSWNGPVVLSLDTADLPDEGFPVTCGVPLHIGRATDAELVGLLDRDGTPVLAQFKALSRWHDGSIRSVLTDFIARPGASPYTLTLDEPTPAAASPVRVSEGADEVMVEAGALRIEFGSDDSVLIRKIAVEGCPEPAAENVVSTMLLADEEEPVRAIRQQVRVLERGPVRAEVEIAGKLAGRSGSVGRFVVRVSAYAGMPILRVSHRIFNDSGGVLPIKEMTLDLPVGIVGDVNAQWSDQSKVHGTAGEGFCLEQPGPDEWLVRGSGLSGQKASGWFRFAEGSRSVDIAVRSFWQQFPKSMRMVNGTVSIGLCSGLVEQTPGEAKRHEMWLRFGTDVCEPQFAILAQRPPRLFDSEYFTATGAFGPGVSRLGSFAEYSAVFERAYGSGELPDNPDVYGSRNFGDSLYSPDQKQWRNCLHDEIREPIVEYLATGNRNWFDRCQERVRHLIDVDQCHDSSDAAKFGGIYTYATQNHTDGGFWDYMLRPGWGLRLFYTLTGDRDALQAMVDLAEFILRNRRMAEPQGSVRDYAGVMQTMVAAFQRTGDERYLIHVRSMVEAILDQRKADPAGTHVDLRRGTFVEIHGNYNYRGNVPWMLAMLSEPLYDYYRLTGDPDAAGALVGFCESAVCEDMTPDTPGDFYGYSHNPHYGKSKRYNALIAPMMTYGYALTGDDYFMQCARAAYEVMVTEESMRGVSYLSGNVPTLLYFLDKRDPGGNKNG